MHYNVWKDVCIRFTSSKALEVTSQPEVPTWQMLLYPPFPVPGHLAGSPMESPDETVKVESVWKTVGTRDSTSGWLFTIKSQSHIPCSTDAFLGSLKFRGDYLTPFQPMNLRGTWENYSLLK